MVVVVVVTDDPCKSMSNNAGPISPRHRVPPLACAMEVKAQFLAVTLVTLFLFLGPPLAPSAILVFDPEFQDLHIFIARKSGLMHRRTRVIIRFPP